MHRGRIRRKRIPGIILKTIKNILKKNLIFFFLSAKSANKALLQTGQTSKPAWSTKKKKVVVVVHNKNHHHNKLIDIKITEIKIGKQWQNRKKK